jgi:nitrogen fixation protein NifX
MKVAFTTATGVKIDESFRDARDFTVWDVSPDGAHYVTSVRIDRGAANEEERITVRANALAGCNLLCTHSINGPSNAKLVARGVHALKIRKDTQIEELIGRLQKVLQGNPPPWMRKIMADEFCLSD